jgi:hypothetical protein
VGGKNHGRIGDDIHGIIMDLSSNQTWLAGKCSINGSF